MTPAAATAPPSCAALKGTVVKIAFSAGM